MIYTNEAQQTTDSIPINLVGVESKNINRLCVLRYTTDAQGVRHVAIQTTATGNDRDGYKTAERHAHAWFFVNYDRGFRFLNLHSAAQVAVLLTDSAIESGYLNQHWLDCPHPVISQGRKEFGFGHHTGLSPTEKEPTWGFQFEILPMEAAI